MWRAKARPRASHQHTFANDYAPNLGLTWILFPTRASNHRITGHPDRDHEGRSKWVSRTLDRRVGRSANFRS